MRRAEEGVARGLQQVGIIRGSVHRRSATCRGYGTVVLLLAQVVPTEVIGCAVDGWSWKRRLHTPSLRPMASNEVGVG